MYERHRLGKRTYTRSREQRKVREGIESLRTIHSRKKVLNSFESLMPLRPLLDKCFDRDNVNTRMRLF